MKLEKKLILCGILAITIGIAAIVPLAFFMTPTQAQTNLSTPWFNINVPYASWTTSVTNGTSEYLYGVGNIDGIVTYNSTYSIILKFTVNPSAVTTLANARVEYYQIQVYSNLGQVENVTEFYGANCTGNADPSSSFNFDTPDWFNTTGSGGTFIGNFNGTLNNQLSINGIGGSSGSSSFANSSLPQDFLNGRNARVLYIDVRRLGYVTFDGNSTIVTLSNNEVVQHLELTKYGDSFIYGTNPLNQMSQIKPLVPSQNP
jgi:hypothetical protein